LEVEMVLSIVAERVAPCRGNLPGPSRRILVEPIEVPAPPLEAPEKPPAEPAVRPDDEPAVPAR
jgi:hypothetical protein